jgi:hypothetical protein
MQLRSEHGAGDDSAAYMDLIKRMFKTKDVE